MREQASFGRKGAPAPEAGPAPGWTTTPDIALNDIGPEDIVPTRIAPPAERAFKLRHWAVLVALALLALGGTGVIILATARQPAPPPAQSTVGLIPADQMPKAGDVDMQRANALAASYPEDPRIHALMAVSWARSGAVGEAALELKQALASPLLHAPEIPAGMEQHIRIMLLGEQLTLKQVDAARETAQPLCAGIGSLDARVQHGLKLIHACDGR